MSYSYSIIKTSYRFLYQINLYKVHIDNLDSMVLSEKQISIVLNKAKVSLEV